MANITIEEWAKQTKERIEACHKRSIELLAEEMTRTKPNGGRVPIKDGYLYKSLVPSQQAMPKTSEEKTEGAADIGAFTVTMDITKPTYLGYTAIYARRMNYGFVGADSLGRVYNQAGNYFVEGAIAEWPNIVKRAIADVKATSKPSKS